MSSTGLASKKGIMSAGIFFLTITVFLVVHVFLTNSIRLRGLTSEELIADRVFYLYNSIEQSTREIIEKQLGNITENVTLNVTVDEEANQSTVTFTEKFPQNASKFKTDLGKYERFVETYLNETNILVDTSISGLGGEMEMEIEPYDIFYTHTEPWANGDKRQYEVKPGSDPNSLQNVASYTIIIQLINSWEVMPERAQWGPLKSGDLGFNMTVISYDGDPLYSTQEYVDRETKSEFKIDTNTTEGGYTEGWVWADISDMYDSGLLFEMHLAEAVVTTKITLNEIPGETKVDLPDGKINVVETLYNIEKNGTVMAL